MSIKYVWTYYVYKYKFSQKVRKNIERSLGTGIPIERTVCIKFNTYKNEIKIIKVNHQWTMVYSNKLIYIVYSIYIYFFLKDRFSRLLLSLLLCVNHTYLQCVLVFKLNFIYKFSNQKTWFDIITEF